MALSDLAVYSEFLYSTATEILRQKIEMFNAASRGTILLRNAAHLGDYSDEVMWAKVSGLVRRRNAYGSGAVAAKTLAQITDTMVKIAAGTPPVNMDPGMLRWIQKNPEEAAAITAKQLAPDMLADFLNTALGAAAVALENVGSTVVNDISGGTNAYPDFTELMETAMLFGDRSNEILAWVLHSTSMMRLYGNALANGQTLFSFGTVNVMQDGFGRVFLVTDSPSLVDSGEYRSLGLTASAIVVDQNNDYDDNFQSSNGDENILRTWQAEWSFNLGLKGYKWDKTNGGPSPSNAALLTGTNWDKYATDIKDTLGVLLRSD